MKSNFPYGLFGWACVQTFLAINGNFHLKGALLSLSLIFVLIVGTEQIAFWIMRKRGNK